MKRRRSETHPLILKFCRNYPAGIYNLEPYNTPDGMARLGLGAMTEEEKRGLAPLLDELTSERHSADELLQLWNNSPADVHFRNGESVRALFKLARQKIG